MKLRFEKCMSRRAYTNPLQRVQDEYVRLDKVIKKMEVSITKKQHDLKIRTIELITKIDTLSPLKILTRGYSIAETDGAVVKSIQQLKIDDKVDVKFADGKIKAKVEEIKSLEY